MGAIPCSPKIDSIGINIYKAEKVIKTATQIGLNLFLDISKLK